MPRPRTSPASWSRHCAVVAVAAAIGLLTASCRFDESADTKSSTGAETRAAAEIELEAGRELFATRDREDLVASADRFERAVELDSTLAEAWSGLADANALLGLYSIAPANEAMPRARDAALKALELEPGLARAHASLGLALYLHDWNWRGAEASFRRAIEIDPGYASSHHWYAMMLSATGRHPEAVARMDAALDADPDSRIIAIKAATVFTAAGELARAEAQLRDCIERFPTAALAHRELGFLRLAEDRVAEALPSFERATELSGGESRSSGGLGYVYGVLGRTEDARRVLRALEERSATEIVPPLYLALVHAGLSETELALDEIERAFDQHDPGLVYLYTKPGLAELQEEDRFLAVGRLVGLPQAKQGDAPGKAAATLS